MHHILCRCGLSAFFERLAHRLVGQRVDMAQFHQPPRQQPQRPAAVPRRRGGASQGDQMGLLRAIELGGVDACARAVGPQRRREPVLDKALAQALDGRDPDLKRLGNAAVAPARPTPGFVRLEQDLRVLERTHIGLAAREHPAQRRAFVCRQRDPIFLLHP
jgi:hypothetical protein